MALTRGTANIGTHAFIPVHFSKKVAAILDDVVVFMDCVNTEWQEDLMESGDIVRIRNYGNINVNSYTVDNSITNQTITEAAQTLVVDQQQYFSFKIDDIDVKQTDLDIFEGYEERAAIAIRNTVDGFLQTQISAAVPAYNTLGTPTMGQVVVLTPETTYYSFVDLYEKLETAKAFGATNQRPWVAVPPKIVAMMRKTGQLTHPTAAGDEMVRSGVIGEFAGFDVKVATNIALTAATGGNDQYYTVLAGVNLGFTFAMQISKIEPIRLEVTFADALRGLFVYGGLGVVPGGLAKMICKV